MAQTQGGKRMKKFKQLAALFLAFAMVLGVFSTPMVAKAATDLTEGDVKIAYTNERLEVSKSDGDVIYYTMKYNATSPASTVWEEAYEDSKTKAFIDFSSTPATKDVVFTLTKDPTATTIKTITVTVKAQEKTLAVTFSGVAHTSLTSKVKADNDWTDLNNEITAFKNFTSEPWSYGYLTVTTGDKTKTVMTASDAALYLEFRKGNTGSWQDLKDLDVRKYTAYGAQLYFRIKAVDVNAATKVASSASITNLGRTSKEVKVTYAKQANAPKVAINGATKEIKLAKTQEYRVACTDDSVKGDWISVATKHVGTDGKVKKVYLKDLLVASGQTFEYHEDKATQSIQVRTAATEKAVASKITTVNLNEVATPDVGSGTAITFKLVKATSYDKGITVTNSTGQAIQVAVVSGSSYDVNDTKTVKWISVKAKGAVTISATELKKGDIILTRTAEIKDVAKTPVNEFKVSSIAQTFNYKEDLKPLSQTFAVSNPTIEPSTVSASAIVAASGSAYTVTVTNTTTPSAITVKLAVATTNVADASSVKIECVTSDLNATTAVGLVKLVADGTITSNAGKLKITIGKDAKASDSRTFRVTVDGYKAYITVNFVNQ